MQLNLRGFEAEMKVEPEETHTCTETDCTCSEGDQHRVLPQWLTSFFSRQTVERQA